MMMLQMNTCLLHVKWEVICNETYRRNNAIMG